MKKRINKILGVALTAVLLASLAMGLATVPAGAGTLEWDKEAFPKADDLGKYFRSTAITDLGPLVMAIDGTMHAYVGGVNKILKSTDGGRSWSTSGPGWSASKGVPVDIAMSTEDADTFWVATNGGGTGTAANPTVFRTTNAGISYTALTQARSTGGNLTGVTDITAGYFNNTPYLYVAESGTPDIFTLDTGSLSGQWTPVGVNAAGATAIYDVACAPDFNTYSDPLVVAAVYNGTSTGVWYKYGGGSWETFTGPGAGRAFFAGTAVDADIEFVDNFGSSKAGGPRSLFVAVDDGTGSDGGVYRVNGDNTRIETAARFNAATVDCAGNSGDVSLLAGTPTGTVKRSSDGMGESWLTARDNPSGTGTCYVVLSQDYLDSDEAFALVDDAAAGDNRQALSRTDDGGVTFNQIALMETDNLGILDLAFGGDDVYMSMNAPDGTIPGQNPDYIRITADSSVGSIAADAVDFTGSATGWVSGTLGFTSSGTATVAITANASGAAYIDGSGVIFLYGAGDTATITCATAPYAAVLTVAGPGAGGEAVTENTDVATPPSADNVVITGPSPSWSILLPDAFIPAGTASQVTLSGITGGVSVSMSGTGTYNAGTGLIDFNQAAETATITATVAGTTGTTAITAGTPTAALTDAGTANSSMTFPGAFTLGDIAIATVTGPLDDLYRYDGTYWERVAYGANIGSVQCSPEYESDSAVFYVDFSTNTIYRSNDGGNRFRAHPPYGSGITGWQVIDDRTVIVAAGKTVKKTSDNGDSYGAPASGLSSANSITSFALSPDFDSDSTILCGDSGNNLVFNSTNGGRSYNPMTEGTFNDGGAGPVFVAFDADFANNGIYYAAGQSSGGGLAVERYKTEWKDISSVAGQSRDIPGSPSTSGPTGMATAPDGSLYVTDGTAAGAFRCLNPTKVPELSVEWEAVTKDITVQLNGLVVTPGSNKLWGYNGADVWTFVDNLLATVALSSPQDGDETGRVDSATLSWDSLGGARSYEIDVNTSPDFRGVDFSPANTPLTSVVVTGLEDGQTYYWRVRVASPLLSRWSRAWSFTTALGAPQWNPFVGGVPEAPYNGATNVSRTPSFAWNPADWATGYEFILAKDAAFTDVVTSKTAANALTGTVYLSEETLDYETTYYWKVRAISKTTNSDWASAVFTTEGEAPPPPPPPDEPPPPPEEEPLIDPMFLWVIIGIGAVLVIALIILIVRTRRVA